MKAFNTCPYPGSCEWDDFRRSGSHICMRVTCPYALAVHILMVWWEKYLEYNKGEIQKNHEPDKV